MPRENIGDFGNGQLPREREWVVACLEFAIAHIKRVIGPPPEGYNLEVIWHDYETAKGATAYPSIGVTWEGSSTFAPETYIAKCEIALEMLDEAVDFSLITPDEVQFRIENDLE